MRERRLNERVLLRVWDGDPVRAALLLPGMLGGWSQPLLRYALLVLQQHGYEVTAVEWEPLRDDAWVIEQARAALDGIAAERPLVVAKSLGSRAAPLAVERGLPAIWLTPLLQLTDVTEALARATAPTLLVGGGADESWDGAVAERLPGERLVIDGADHALEIAGDPYASLDALRRVTARVDGFVAALATL